MNSIEYSQLYSILLMLGNSYIQKLPTSIIDEIQNNIDKNYIIKFNINTIGENQILSINVLKVLEKFNSLYWKNKKAK